MTDDALDRACEAAWDVYRNMTGERWADLSETQQDESRAEIAAALRVMADDLSAALQHDAEAILTARGRDDGRTHHDDCWQFHADCALLRAASMARGWLDD